MKRVLTIAGSDSSGGAGIEADIKTLAAMGVHGTTVITSVTAQNSGGFISSAPMPSETVAERIKATLGDIGADAVKTGMLVNKDIVQVVADSLKKFKVSNLVVDPIISAGLGGKLLDKEGADMMIKKLIPLSTLVTPNIPEAEFISEIKIKNYNDIKKAAQIIGNKKTSVLIKGGHINLKKGFSVDTLFHNGQFISFESERLEKGKLHGTGCVLSSAIAAGLANGRSIPDAVGWGKNFINEAIKGSYSLGKNELGFLNQSHSLIDKGKRYTLLEEMDEAVDILTSMPIGSLIPEIQSNLVAAIEGAEGVDDVVGIPGRIIKVGEWVTTVSPPSFGGSNHVARIVLTAMRFDSSMRSCINLAYSPEIIKACRVAGLKVKDFSRNDEPKFVKDKEGSTLEWGVSEAIKKCGFVPDIIYDKGGVGKEAVSRVMGTSPLDVIEKVEKIAEVLGCL
ncbi:MAG: bifunctional hydroxymethylpyrimidine kinase/phosphomethylpyrimidine kinase [Nitrospinota bacterium]|nr:bifunctional hydroxymethylpyrimidine kinase/phosphomethylpyrimidine kinase [Nitrospinota bacterium]